MRYLVGFVVVLVALGVVPLVGCGPDHNLPHLEYPECRDYWECSDGDQCTDDICVTKPDGTSYAAGLCEHRAKSCERDSGPYQIFDECVDVIVEFYCDPDTGQLECTYDYKPAGTPCCDWRDTCCLPICIFPQTCCWSCCKREGVCTPQSGGVIKCV